MATQIDKDVHFIHRRETADGFISNNGGFTIAYRVVDPMHVEYAISRCGPHDNFSKHLGRVKAAGRLKSEKYRTEVPMTFEQFKEYAHVASLYDLWYGLVTDDLFA